jgi:NADH:ubiquinone oxidoreductase subunit 5 (subunit L)/multisubunit Na+/H+ antiporter MnhA subunit
VGAAAGRARRRLGAARALRANLEDDAKTLLACSTIENVGFVTIGLGLALAFRGADLGTLAALAAGAALLHALNHGCSRRAVPVRRGGARGPQPALDGWGAGPRHAGHGGCALVGALAAASLPPLSGFAANGLLLHRCWRLAGAATSPSRSTSPRARRACRHGAHALAAAAMVRLFGLFSSAAARRARAGAQEVRADRALALLCPPR